ncbi:MAG: hypothetical protein PHE43_03510 [Candidatus Nanoarchaeia archaeon]|nr:hypothetical protein [Candidatus Nanoarchaeia archaeon]
MGSGVVVVRYLKRRRGCNESKLNSQAGGKRVPFAGDQGLQKILNFLGPDGPKSKSVNTYMKLEHEYMKPKKTKVS